MSQAVAPIPAIRSPKPWAVAGDYALILYPFIRGQSAKGIGLSDLQWKEYGRILRAIHDATLPDAVLRLIPCESFVSGWAAGVRRMQTSFEACDDLDRHVREFVAVWKHWSDQIRQIVERTEELGRRLRGRPGEFVLCHTDPHRGNLLLDADGRVFLVD